MKRHLFYTFLGIFIATSVVTLLGVTGIIHIVDGYLWPLVAAFLIELAGAVVAVFSRAEFFHNPLETSVPVGYVSIPEHKKAIAALQKAADEKMAAQNAKNSQEMHRITKLYSEGKGILIPESILRQQEQELARHDKIAAGNRQKRRQFVRERSVVPSVRVGGA
jgi:hypothetical protein